MTDVFPRYNTLPKYVVSTSLGEGDLVDNWGETTILRSLDEVAALREGEGVFWGVRGRRGGGGGRKVLGRGAQR